MRLLFVLVSMLAVACGGSGAASTGSSNGTVSSGAVVFAFRPRVGDVLPGRGRTAMDFNGTAVVVESQHRLRVARVSPEGHVDIVTECLSMETVTPDGTRRPSACHEATTDTYDSSYRTLTQGARANAAGFSFGGMFPDHPVRVGESWSFRFDRPIEGGTITGAATATLREVRAGQARVEFSGPLSGDTVEEGFAVHLDGQTEGAIEVDLASGHIHDVRMTIRLVERRAGFRMTVDLAMQFELPR